MRRVVFSAATLALALAMGAAPACFPNFTVTTGNDGGSSGSGGGSGSSSGSGSGSGSGGGSGSSSGSGSGGGSGSGSSSGSGSGGSLPDGGAVTGDGGSAPYDAATQFLVPHGSFVFNDISGQAMTTATLTNDTLFDKTEVTVAAFDAWITAGMTVPADNQSLDPGGPYQNVMFWQGGDTWSNYAALQEFKDSTNCIEAQALSDNDNPPNEYLYTPTYVTYENANKSAATASYPITCVNFYQAVAYCWWAGQKRLPTEVEWQYEITGRGRSYTYPWGNSPDPTDCSLAIWRSTGNANDNYNGCGFPLAVGSAPKGASFDGVLDMQGSVEEWIWNSENNEFPTAWPPNYAGPAEDGGVDLSRTARSGSFFTANDESPTKNLDGRMYDAFGTPSTTTFADLGFRCVKSRL